MITKIILIILAIASLVFSYVLLREVKDVLNPDGILWLNVAEWLRIIAMILIFIVLLTWDKFLYIIIALRH
jgi:hypothetical protein